MGDALLSRCSRIPESSFRPKSDLERAVELARGRSGSRLLATALDLCRAGVWSPGESKTRLLIVRAGCREPDRLNEPQFDSRGRLLGVPDMASPSERTAIEYEGRKFHDSRSGRFEEDILKGERFAAANWRVLRVTSSQLREKAGLSERFRQFLPPAE